MTAEFDQLVAQFEEFQAQIHNVDDRFSQLAGMRGELENLEVSASSADRSVTVVTGPGGSVRDIRLTEEALRHGAQRLGSMIMSTLQDAVADAARQQAGIVQEYVDAPVLDQVLETQSEVTGVPVEELRDKVPARRREPDDDDRDDQEQPVLRDSFDVQSTREGDEYLRDLSDEED